jgi:indole-3-glycerol phosphate synthase
MKTTDFLNNILGHKRQIIKKKEAFFSSLKKDRDKVTHTRYQLFKRMISARGQINLIAEIKKASPSKGVIRDNFDLLDIAKVYEQSKAAAISILTEDKYFLGKPEYIKKVTAQSHVPVLAKDFFIDEGQIYEAWYNGASAVLLIVTILDEGQLKSLLQIAASLDIDCLVEVHDEEELEKALGVGAEIIGVNNRNLLTFEVDTRTCANIIPNIPKDKVIVAESGIHTPEDIDKLRELGAHAVLIGETFMRAEDIGNKIQEIMGIQA